MLSEIYTDATTVCFSISPTERWWHHWSGSHNVGRRWHVRWIAIRLRWHVRRRAARHHYNQHETSYNESVGKFYLMNQSINQMTWHWIEINQRQAHIQNSTQHISHWSELCRYGYKTPAKNIAVNNYYFCIIFVLHKSLEFYFEVQCSDNQGWITTTNLLRNLRYR